MKIPKYIKNKMHAVVRYSRASDEAMQEVEDWLKRNGFSIEPLRDGDGRSLEELEYGNDIVDIICERIEEMEP